MVGLGSSGSPSSTVRIDRSHPVIKRRIGLKEFEILFVIKFTAVSYSFSIPPIRFPNKSAHIALPTERIRAIFGFNGFDCCCSKKERRSRSSSRIDSSSAIFPKPKSRRVCKAKRRCSLQSEPSANMIPKYIRFY